MSLRIPMDGGAKFQWVQNWTIFYWAWWVSWAPFVGIFIARVSRGRTIKEFILGVLFAPALVSFFSLQCSEEQQCIFSIVELLILLKKRRNCNICHFRAFSIGICIKYCYFNRCYDFLCNFCRFGYLCTWNVK